MIIDFIFGYWRLLLLAAAVAGVVGYGAHQQSVGRDKVIAELRERVATSEKARTAISAAADKRWAERSQQVKVIKETILKEVPVYVTEDDPDVSGAFRVLHDAAAHGIIPNPARVANAAPASAQDLARTITENYSVYNSVAEQLRELQKWVDAQQKAPEN